MATEPTPQFKEPHDMSDEELAEAIAVEVMGWDKENLSSTYCKQCGHHIEDNYFWTTSQTSRPCKTWQPLTDWNHWRQVEEKMFQDDELYKAYVTSLVIVTRESGRIALMDMIKADLRTRCIAAFLAVRSLPKP